MMNSNCITPTPVKSQTNSARSSSSQGGSEVKRGTSKVFRDISTIKWMKKRYEDKAMPKYTCTATEYKKHKEIETIFNKFDDDGSGSLSIDEIFEML